MYRNLVAGVGVALTQCEFARVIDGQLAEARPKWKLARLPLPPVR
jgi:hypothetical protein